MFDSDFGRRNPRTDLMSVLHMIAALVSICQGWPIELKKKKYASLLWKTWPMASMHLHL